MNDSNPPALPLNFPQSFLPERRFLSALLAFAEQQGSGEKEAISAATGIPTGKSTGKVVPLIHYALGMGLITATRQGASWQLGLTPVGARVRREDPYLSEPLTLWLLHLLLCRRRNHNEPATGVADAWFLLFAEGPLRLGTAFTAEDFQLSFAQRHGALGYLKGLATLVPKMYLEDSCFGMAKILLPTATAETRYCRGQAPRDRAFFPAYALTLWLFWDALFADQTQLSLDEFARVTRWQALLGWDAQAMADWLQWLTRQGWLQLDQHTGSAVLLRLVQTETLIAGLYAELV